MNFLSELLQEFFGAGSIKRPILFLEIFVVEEVPVLHRDVLRRRLFQSRKESLHFVVLFDAHLM